MPAHCALSPRPAAPVPLPRPETSPLIPSNTAEPPQEGTVHSADTAYDLDEPRNHYAQWKEPVAEATHCLIPLIRNVWRREIRRGRKQVGSSQGLGRAVDVE